MVKLYEDNKITAEPIYDKSEVLNELIKLTLKKIAAPSPNPYQEDVKTIEEKRLDAPKESIIETAHPKPVYVAESQGDGGLVENQLEQQKKMLSVINRMPTGVLVGRYAYVANSLLKLADVCDDCGEPKTADLITNTAKTILEKAKELERPLAEAPVE